MRAAAGRQAFDERRRNNPNRGLNDACDVLMVAAANAGAEVEMPPRYELKDEGAKHDNARGQVRAIHLRTDVVWVHPYH